MPQIDIWNQRFSAIPCKADCSREVWISKYDQYFLEKKSTAMIDLGCGRGQNSQYLYKNGFNIVACDFSPIVLEQIKAANKSIATKCFDLTQEYPIPKGSIGCVLVSLSTHYFSIEDTKLVYRHIFDILENGGYFIFRVNSLREYSENDKDEVVSKIEDDYYLLRDGVTKRYFSMESIAGFLRDFRIIELKEDSFLYYGNQKHCIEGIAQKSS